MRGGNEKRKNKIMELLKNVFLCFLEKIIQNVCLILESAIYMGHINTSQHFGLTKGAKLCA